MSQWTPPAEAAPYAELIAQSEQAHLLPKGLLARVLYQESRFRPDIIDGTVQSPAGAKGIAQFMDATAAERGIDPLDPAQAIPAAAQYLAQHYRKYGSWDKALAAYNWGQGNVERKGLDKAPPETQNYIRDILTDVGLEALPVSEAVTSQVNLGKATPTAPGGLVLDQQYEDAMQSVREALETATAPTEAPLVPLSGPGAGTTQAEQTPVEELYNAMPSQQAARFFDEAVDWSDKVVAAFQDTALAAGYRTFTDPSFTPDASFDSVRALDQSNIFVRDTDDYTYLLESRSADELAFRAKRLEERNEQQRTLAAGSIGGTLAAALVAGAADPLTYAAGLGGAGAVARAGLAGYRGAMLGAAAGNLGYDGLRDALGADLSAADYFASAALGAGIGGLGFRFGGVQAEQAMARAQRVAANVETQEQQFREAARMALGPTADDAAIRQYVDQAWEKQAGEVLEILSAPVPENQRLMSLDEGAEAGRVGGDPAAVGNAERPLLADAGDAVALNQEILDPEPGRLSTLLRRAREFVTGRNEIEADPDGLELIANPELREQVRNVIRRAENQIADGVLPEAVVRGDVEGIGKMFKPGESAFVDAFRSSALTLLGSDSPVAKVFAARILENTTGVARNRTAAISKAMWENVFIGDVKREMDEVFQMWRAATGRKSIVKEALTDADRSDFYREVFEYREGVRNGIRITQQADAVLQKADRILTRQFDLMRRAQIKNRVAGFGNLPNTSEGYTPWVISPAKWMRLSQGQRLGYANALSQEWQKTLGWDAEFANGLARRYLERVDGAIAGRDTPNLLPGQSSLDDMEAAMRAMNLDPTTVQARLQEFTRGGAKQTRNRADRNLLTPYDASLDGKTTDYFRLMDVMETDVVGLLQRQARRVSGEVALAQYGIQGRTGAAVMRRAIEAQLAKSKPEMRRAALRAYDQTMAEMLATPFGTQLPQFVDNLRAWTSLAQLGGLGWAQLSELGNVVSAFGVRGLMDAIPAFPRLLSEVRRLSKGDSVKDSILAGMDDFYPVGMEVHRTSFAHQMPGDHMVTYSADAPGAITRMARKGQHVQGTLSFWRALQAVQNRYVGEQIMRRGLHMIEGDARFAKTLKDMGLSEDLIARMRKQLPEIVTRNGAGQIIGVNFRAAPDRAAALEYMQVINRGTKQIIQGTFIGETGMWAHSGGLKFMTQFRTYSITSLEKQIGRQYRNRGLMGMFGALVGAISVTAPIVAARYLAASALMPAAEREEYLDRMLSPERFAVAAIGYTALGGGARDLFDIGGTVAGFDVPGSPRVPSGGVITSMIPALGLVEDALNIPAEFHKEDSNIAKAASQVMPFKNTPLILPLVNSFTSR